jgi:type IV pilus assembly protein PilF
VRVLSILLLCLFVGVIEARSDSSGSAERTKTALALLEQGKTDQALGAFREALKLDPDSVEARLGLASIHDRQGAIDEAIEEYQRVLSLQPGNTVALNNLGVLYDQKGLYGDAIQRFEKVLQTDPNNDNARKNLGISNKNKALKEERQTRIGDARRRVEANPKSPRASYELARLYAAAGEKEQAFDWLDRAIKLGFNDFDYLRRDSAIEALRADPRFTKILNRN